MKPAVDVDADSVGADVDGTLKPQGSATLHHPHPQSSKTDRPVINRSSLHVSRCQAPVPQKAQAAVVTVGLFLEAPNDGPLSRLEQQGVVIEQFAQFLVQV